MWMALTTDHMGAQGTTTGAIIADHFADDDGWLTEESQDDNSSRTGASLPSGQLDDDHEARDNERQLWSGGSI